MKNLLVLLAIVVFMSCKKSQDPIPNYTINASSIIWQNNTSVNFTKIDSCRFDIYNNIHDMFLIKSVYTNYSGLCNIILKGDQEYYFVCYSPSYKNASNTLYHYEYSGKITSNNNLIATFIYASGSYSNGSSLINSYGSTNIIYVDPLN